MNLLKNSLVGLEPNSKNHKIFDIILAKESILAYIGGNSFLGSNGKGENLSMRSIKMMKATGKVVVVCCLLIAAVFIAAGCKKADSTDITNPLTLRYTINYDTNGGTGTVPASVTITFAQFATETAATKPADLAKGTETFGGWNTQADGSGTAIAAGASFSTISSTLTADADRIITLYAQWS